MPRPKLPSFFDEQETQSELVEIRRLLDESQLAGNAIPRDLSEGSLLNKEDSEKVMAFYLSILKIEAAYATLITRLLQTIPTNPEWIGFYGTLEYSIIDVLKAQVMQYFGSDKTIDELMPIVQKQNEMAGIALRAIERAEANSQSLN